MKTVRAMGIFTIFAGALAAAAHGAEPHYALQIARQPLDAALQDLAHQTGLQIARFSDTKDGSAPVGPVAGDLSAQQALDTLLASSTLTYKIVDARTIAVVERPVPPEAAAAGTADVARATLVPTLSQYPEAANGPHEELAEVVVTGTNIKTADKAALPVSVIDRDALLAVDASTPSELLTSLPEVPSAPLNETANSSFSARGDFAAVNLRGIGTGNTLVLLNGHRLVPHPISSTDEGGLPSSSVNVNQLPTLGLDHVDILRDGASSIYGTDAVAGVVNFVTDTKFRGLEVSGRATGNEHADGREERGGVRFGADFADGRAHVISQLDYYIRGSIYLRDRDFSDYGNHTASAPAPWNAPSSLIPLSANPFYGLQSTGAYPSFKVGSSTATTYLVPQTNGTVGLTNTAPARGVNDSNFFNLNQYQAVQPGSHRLNLFNQLDYDLTPDLVAFGELSYYHADSLLVRQPVAYNSANFTDAPVVVPTNSPWNPFGQPVTLLNRYLTDLGPEEDTISDTVYRILAGLRGQIGATWSWESAALYSRGTVTDIGHNDVRQSLFQQAVQSGAYNPFGVTFTNQAGKIAVAGPYTNPAGASAPFLADLRRDGASSLASMDFRITGDVVSNWAGTLAAAFGGEFRREEFSFYMPPYAGLNPPGSGLPIDDNDFLLAGPAANWSAGRNVTSAYGETIVPLVAPQNGIPLLYSLDLTASVRYEHYSDFGSATKPKFGATWRPLDGLVIRGSYNEGFRAPNLPLLAGGQRKTLQSFLDPVLNLTGPHWSVLASNPNLQPENSVGKSLGVVFDVPRSRGLTLTADYWEIAQKNLITTTSINDILTADATLLAPIIAQNPGVPAAQLNFGSGTSSYKGDPRVIRNAADNSIYEVLTPPFNSAKGFISGLDLSLIYHIPEFGLGRFQVRSDWTHLFSDYNYASGGALRNDLIDRDGAARWRGNLALNWSKAHWAAGASAFYIGSFQDSNVTLPTSTPALATQSAALYEGLGSPGYIAKSYNLGNVVYRYVVPSTITYNAFLGYDFYRGGEHSLKDANVRLGVINLTDVKPPLDGGFTGFRTNVYTSLVPGRTWTLDFSFQL